MSDVDALVSAGKKFLLNNYRQAPVAMSRGEGCVLWDTQGRRYLDMTAGIAVCVLGHGDPGLAQTLGEQARRLIHTSNLYYVENQIRLADALVRRGFPGRAFFAIPARRPTRRR
ncbi:MAG: aminotransferase class III-fold pyridoxal phosphate-dependent enzyme [Myxococcales bacterium]